MFTKSLPPFTPACHRFPPVLSGGGSDLVGTFSHLRDEEATSLATLEHFSRSLQCLLISPCLQAFVGQLGLGARFRGSQAWPSYLVTLCTTRPLATVTPSLSRLVICCGPPFPHLCGTEGLFFCLFFRTFRRPQPFFFDIDFQAQPTPPSSASRLLKLFLTAHSKNSSFA